MNYLAIKGRAKGNQAHYGFLQGYEEGGFRFKKCEPMAADFPSDAFYKMSDDYPENVELVDVLHVLNNTLVVSGEAKNVLESAGVADVEFFSVRVLNHKGRAVKRDYFVANALKKIDCIDKDKTVFKWHPIDKTMMKNVSNLTIDESKIDGNVTLFRMQHLPLFLWVRKDVVDKLTSAGLQGFEVIDLENLKL